MTWDWKGIKPNQFPLIFSPRAAGSHSMYLVESGLNSSTSKRNKHQHRTEHKLCKHISIYRTEASKTRFKKWKEQRDTESKVAHFSIITCSHNYQIQDKAVAVTMLVALNKTTTCALIPVCTLLDHMAKNVQQFQILRNMMNYKDTAKASKLHKVLSIYIWKETAHIPKSFNPPEN